MNKAMFAALMAVLMHSQYARADFYIEIEDAAAASYLPNDEGVLTVWGSTNEPSTISLETWALGFKLSTPSVWSSYELINSAIPDGMLSKAPSNPALSPNNFDVLARSTGGTPTDVAPSPSPLSPVRFKMFDIKFTVSASAASGDYTLSFVPDAEYLAGGGPSTLPTNSVGFDGGSVYNNANGNLLAPPSGAFSGFNGQFTITAVPEPSSMALVGLGAVGFAAWKRRRNRSAAPEQGTAA